MKYIYAIRDRIANELIGSSMYILFAFRTDQQAVRYFADCILDEKSILAKHPNDYELIQLGWFAENEAQEYIEARAPKIIITGSALIAATTEHQPVQLVKES